MPPRSARSSPAGRYGSAAPAAGGHPGKRRSAPPTWLPDACRSCTLMAPTSSPGRSALRKPSAPGSLPRTGPGSSGAPSASRCPPGAAAKARSHHTPLLARQRGRLGGPGWRVGQLIAGCLAVADLAVFGPAPRSVQPPWLSAEDELVQDLPSVELPPVEFGEPGSTGSFVPLSTDDLDLLVVDRLGLRGAKQVCLAGRAAGDDLAGALSVAADRHRLISLGHGSGLRANVVGP